MDGNARASVHRADAWDAYAHSKQAFGDPYDPSAQSDSLRRLADFSACADEIATQMEYRLPPRRAPHPGRPVPPLGEHWTDGLGGDLASRPSEEESAHWLQLPFSELSARARARRPRLPSEERPRDSGVPPGAGGRATRSWSLVHLRAALVDPDAAPARQRVPRAYSVPSTSARRHGPQSSERAGDLDIPPSLPVEF